MALIFAQQTIPQDAWLIVGTETACKLMLASANVLAYSSGSPDTLPALTAAAVLGGGTTFDRTADTYVAYTVQGSTTLSICKESAVSGLTGTYALLCRVLLHEIAPIQSTGSSGSGMTNPMTTEGDIIYEHSGVPARLAIGSAGQVLSVASGDPAWAALSVAATSSPVIYPFVSTFANDAGTVPPTGDGGTAIAATMAAPSGFSFSPDGKTLYVCDGLYVRAVTLATGLIAAFAGQVNTSGHTGDGGAATSATLVEPGDTATDGSGVVYIADYDTCSIRKVSSGTISLVAGNYTPGFTGDGGAATSAELNNPTTVCVAHNGDLYIADSSNNRIRKVTASNGHISTICGNGTAANTGDGGAASSAQIHGPKTMRLDPVNNYFLLVSCAGNVIRKIDLVSGLISTPISLAWQPYGLCLDGQGRRLYYASQNVYVYDLVAGTTTQIAGTGVAGDTDDTAGVVATSAKCSEIDSMAVGPDGTLYIADSANFRIRRIVF